MEQQPQPKKIIKVKKPDGQSSSSAGSQHYGERSQHYGDRGQHGGGQYGDRSQQKQDTLKILENTVRKLANRFSQYGFNDSKEEEFLNDNKGKQVTLELASKDIQGTLDIIDKYRIGIIIDGKLHYFYKHAVTGYFVSE